MPHVCVMSVLLAICVCTQSLAHAYDDRLRQALVLQQAGQWSLAIQAIGTLEVTDTPTPALGRLLYLRGKLALQIQNTEAARHDFAQVLYTYPPLGDYAGWEILQHYAAQDDAVKLYDTFVVLTRRYHYSRLLPDSYILLAQVLLRQAQHAQAQVLLEQLLHTYDSPHRVAPEALSLLAQSYADTGQTARAAQTWQRLGESYPTHTLAAGALQRSVNLFAQLPAAQRSMPAPEQLLTSLDALIRARLWPEVEFRLSLLEASTQPPSLVSGMLLKRATAALQQRQLTLASTTLDTLLRRFPQGEHVAEAAYLLGQVAQQQGQAAECEQHYRRVMTNYPTSPWAAEALSALAALFAGRQQTTPAVELYERLAQDFPGHEKAADGLWEAGWGQYRQQHYGAAARIFRRFAELLPHADMLPQVLYWQARALHQQGQPQVAAQIYQRLVEEYPFHYYSRQAANRLREAGRPVSHTAMAAAVAPDWHPPHLVTLPAEALMQPNQLQFHLIRVQELRQLHMHREASREISQLGTLLPDTRETTYFLSKLCVDNQDYLAAFRYLNGLFKALRPAEVRGLPRAIWTMLYPKPFWDEVEQQARATALDPYLVVSIMRQESAFAPTAVSSAGARGLMQLMPGTAQQVSQRLQLGKVTNAMLEQPQHNIMLGTHYFASMLKRYEGNVVLALAAYNAGPGRADRWLKEWPATPQDEFIERIPFQETRLYVKLILRNMLNYERLYKALSDS